MKIFILFICRFSLMKTGAKIKKIPTKAFPQPIPRTDFRGQRALTGSKTSKLLCMKFLPLLLILLPHHLLLAQPDTIAVNNTGTVSVILGGEIEMVDIGHPAYINQTHENTLLLKAAVIDAPPTTLFVRYIDEDNKQRFFSVFIAYEKSPRQFHYDLRPPEKPKPKAESPLFRKASNEKLTPEAAHFKKNLSQLKELQREIYSVGLIQNRVEAGLELVRADKEYFYLRFSLTNQSSLPVRIAWMSFQIQSGSRGRVGSKLQEVSPVFTDIPGELEAYGRISCIAVLPIISLQKKDRFLIRMGETGSRGMDIDIPARYLLDVKTWL